LFEDLQNEPLSLSPISLAYARQLHELTQYAYVHSPRPKYFRLKSVLRHQYIQPILRQNKSLRKVVEGSNSRFAKWLERIIAK